MMKGFYLYVAIALAFALYTFFSGDIGSALVCSLLMVAPALDAFGDE